MRTAVTMRFIPMTAQSTKTTVLAVCDDALLSATIVKVRKQN